MNLLADEGIDRQIVERLRQEGYGPETARGRITERFLGNYHKGHPYS